MPYTVTHIDAEDGLIVTWTGKVDEKEMLQCCRENFKPLKWFAKLRYILADCSDTTQIDISPRTIQAIAQICNQIAPFNNRLHFVWAMPTDKLFALGRMWQSYTDGSLTGWHSWITRKRNEAETWLRDNLDAQLQFACEKTGYTASNSAG